MDRIWKSAIQKPVTHRASLMQFLVEIEGYRAKVERDREGILHGHVLEMEEIIYFKASSMRMVETNFARALGNYLENCKARGIEPKKPAGPAF